MPSPWGIGRAATLLKTLLQYYGKSLEALPGVAYPGSRDNRSTLNTKTGYKKKKPIYRFSKRVPMFDYRFSNQSFFNGGVVLQPESNYSFR